MALVPFRVSGAAASQQLDQQLLQIGPHSLLLQQRPRDSGNTAHLQQQARQDAGDDQCTAAGNTAASATAPPAPPDLSRVGLVLWQSGFVLSDFLLLRLPALQPERWGSWAGVRVLELGSGAGTVGLFLALAGAQLNFPQLAAAQPSPAAPLQASSATEGGSSNSHTKDGPPAAAAAAAAGSFGRRGATAATPHHRAAADGGAAASEPLSAAAAFAAVFGTGSSDNAADPRPPPAADPCLWQVFGRGPLVAEHSWGEPVQQLRSRVEAAAAARITSGDADGPPETAVQQQQGGSARAVMADALHSYDAVVGADLLYDPSCHAGLLATLDAVCSAHTQVFLCYRVRGLGEAAFEAAAAAAGWALQVAPPGLLHEEFQGGDYRLLCLSKIG